jgi:hypothetical protein
MSRIISTSTNPIGYWVSLPEHIEEELGSHFEHLTKSEQYTLLALFADWMANKANLEGEAPSLRLRDIYDTIPGYLPDIIAELLDEIEDLERTCDGYILALTEALVLNIHYTHVEEP